MVRFAPPMLRANANDKSGDAAPRRPCGYGRQLRAEHVITFVKGGERTLT